MRKLSTRCPYCYGNMLVKTLLCQDCQTEVTGVFEVSRFLALSVEQQKFATEFILSSGSLKEMAQKLRVSYPTVRARLDRIIESLEGSKPAEGERRAAILDAVEEKRISAREASMLLDNADEQEG